MVAEREPDDVSREPAEAAEALLQRARTPQPVRLAELLHERRLRGGRRQPVLEIVTNDGRRLLSIDRE